MRKSLSARPNGRSADCVRTSAMATPGRTSAHAPRRARDARLWHPSVVNGGGNVPECGLGWRPGSG